MFNELSGRHIAIISHILATTDDGRGDPRRKKRAVNLSVAV